MSFTSPTVAWTCHLILESTLKDYASEKMGVAFHSLAQGFL